jgi:hypothetical protein
MVPVPIQSARGAALLADVAADDRLRALHVVIGASRWSGGPAGRVICERTLAPRAIRWFALHLPGLWDFGYGLVAGNRRLVGRLVPRTAVVDATRAIDHAISAGVRDNGPASESGCVNS